MANKKHAIKALKQSEKRKLQNQSRKSEVKTYIKEVKEALKNGKNKEEVMKLFSLAASKIQRASTKKVLHSNTASRKVSRLALSINKHFSV